MLQYPNSTYSYVSSPKVEKDGESCLESERRCESEHWSERAKVTESERERERERE